MSGVTAKKIRKVTAARIEKKGAVETEDQFAGVTERPQGS